MRTGYLKSALLSLLLAFAIVGAISLPHYVVSATSSQAYGTSMERRDFSGSPPAQSWDASVTATFSGGSDDAIFGVWTDATSGFDSKYDIPEPPAPPKPYVRAYFYYPGQVLDELQRSCLAPENLMEWPLKIEYADNIENVTLTWNIENVPTEYNVILYKGENIVPENFAADMRAEDNYTFEAKSRDNDFRIVVRLPEVSIDVSISPSSQSGAPGTTLSYTVTVTNTGDNSDTFDLWASGGAGWAPTLADNSLSIAAGTFKTTTLRVTVPSGATSTTITVTARSRADPSVSDSASCRAVAVVPPAVGVGVSISPRHQDGAQGETLRYVVTVTNTGDNQDTYDLVAGDNTGWNPSLSKNSLTIPSKASDTVTLSVTIPGNAPVCTVDGITVVATSRTSSNITGRDSCTAHVIQAGLRVIQISITPENQSGAPGATLNYTVGVTNGSDQVHVFDLQISGGAGWEPRVSPSSLTLATGASGTATLSVTVPSGVSGGSSVGIAVTATSRVDPTISGSASCRAIATAPSALPLAVPLIAIAIIIILIGGYLLLKRKGIRRTKRVLYASTS